MRSLTLAVGLVFVTAGCSGDPASEVTGQVTFMGKPLPDGAIRFVPRVGTNSPPASATITNGTYTISQKDKLVAGKYLVEITARRKTGKKVPIPDSPPGTEREEDEQYIPSQYNVKSRLEVDLNAGPNTKEFALTESAEPAEARPSAAPPTTAPTRVPGVNAPPPG